MFFKMKLVFDLDEIADSLGLTPEAFESARPQLELNGFPKHVAGLPGRWAIVEVLRWVNRDTHPLSSYQHEVLSQVGLIPPKLS
jgi:hypothetical protein